MSNLKKVGRLHTGGGTLCCFLVVARIGDVGFDTMYNRSLTSDGELTLKLTVDNVNNGSCFVGGGAHWRRWF